jgi:phosphoribosyl 1,2-cyclic phosphodiesterase
MRVRFWGVRGSLPVPGPRTERYGGNTSCVEVVSDAGTRIIIDAGTGIRKLGKELMRTEFESGRGLAHILISHTHWDHIQGLPFFSPLYQAGNKLMVYARRRDDVHLRSVFASQAQSPYFPVPFDETRADVTFRELQDSARFEIDDVRVSCARLNHPYIATAYALSADGAKVAYVSDTAPFADILFGQDFVPGPPAADLALSPSDQERLGAMRAEVVRLCEGADLVVYDTMFTPEDYRQMPHYGHSRPSDAIEICRDAGARMLALYHHAPERSDGELDEMLVEARRQSAASARGLHVVASYEGLDVPLGGGAAAAADDDEAAGAGAEAAR